MSDIESIRADEALEAAEQFERDLINALDHAPDDFTNLEQGALEWLIYTAAARVTICKRKVFGE